MNPFLKVVLVLLAALVAIKLLPLTMLFFGLLCAAIATMAALGLSAVAVLLAIGLTLALLLSPLWVPVLAIVGIVALVRAGTRKTA
jgi:hypothetical protein